MNKKNKKEDTNWQNKTKDQINTGKLIFVFSKDILKKIDNFVHNKKLLMLYRSSYENAQ